MYSVGLSNKSCLFDSHSGFEAPEEALDWASDRGRKYTIQISDDRRPDWQGLVLSANDTKRGMRYEIYYPETRWVSISRADILEMLR